MPLRSMTRRLAGPGATVLILSSLVLGSASFTSQLSAQEGQVVEQADDAANAKAAAKVRKPRRIARKPKPDVMAAAPTTKPMPAPPPTTVTTGPAAPAAPGSVDFAAQLDKAGASACRAQINALATSTMGSVVAFNTLSNWAPDAGDKRAVSMAIAQRYPAGSKVPFALSQVVASPNQQGKCDGLVTQILPSPLSCEQLRTSIVKQGRQVADLAGIVLLEDANGRSMLIPTASNSCVLVASRAVYSSSK